MQSDENKIQRLVQISPLIFIQSAENFQQNAENYLQSLCKVLKIK